MANRNNENYPIIDANIASSDESECSDIERSAAEAIAKTLPAKSKLNYEIVYKKFCAWCDEKRVKIISENVMLCYFNEKSKVVKSSTIWCEYSKLKCMIYKERRVDISKFHGVIAFLKRNGVGHIAKKLKVLTGDDFNKFIMEADDDKFLMMKVALIIGIGGACRRVELAKLSVKDVVDSGEYLHIDIEDTKNYEPRDFVITESGLKYNLLGIVRKYMSLRKSHTPHDRFFVSYRNGQCSTQPVGINTIGAIPKQIATFCGLDGPALYTGHCFRRSSATLLADAGADLYVIKRHGGWRSDKVAAGYVQSSVTSKRKVAAKILGGLAFQRSSSNNVDLGDSPSTGASVSRDIIANSIDTVLHEIDYNITELSGGHAAALNDTIDSDDSYGAGITLSRILGSETATATTHKSHITHTMSQSVTIIKGSSAATASPDMPVPPNFTNSHFTNCTFNFYPTFHGKSP